MRGVRAILFDLGDTLIDFGPTDTLGLFVRGARLAYRYLQELGQPVPPFRQFHRRQLRAVRWQYLRSRLIRREFNCLDLLGRMSRKMGQSLTDEQVQELAWRWYWPLGRCATVEDGTASMLAGLRDRGLRLGVVSNTFVPGQVLDRHLELLRLLEYFPTRVYSCDVRYRKPHRRIFEIALERIGAAAGASMFVGDSLRADVQGARRVGMIPVLKDPSGAKASGRIRPAHRIVSLRELPAVVSSCNGAG